VGVALQLVVAAAAVGASRDEEKPGARKRVLDMEARLLAAADAAACFGGRG
jgi:hypothetical protein